MSVHRIAAVGTGVFGNTFVMTVVTSGGFTPLTYQWRKNGTGIGGATLNALAFTSLALDDAGTYVCRVRDAETNSVSSDDAVIAVANHVAIATQPVSLTVARARPRRSASR